MVDLFEGFNTESLFGLDICFVIDSTGSMISYITGAKNSIKEIMNQSSIRFKKYKADESMLKFGIVAYRDHPPQEHSFVTKEKDFTDFEGSTKFLEELNASGGGDPPEAVLDGLHDAIFKLNWRDTSEKILFLLLDNPGHGMRWGTVYDCPCGYHEKEILREMKNKQISLVVLRPKEENHKLDRMLDEFSKYIDLETYALTKYSYHSYYVNETSESKETSELETRILENLRNKRKNKFTSKNTISKTSSESPKRRERERNVLDSEKRRSRSRSRSRSISETDVDMTSKKINGGIDLKLSPKEEYKPKSSMIITDENCLERGIKDIITNTVILKLDKQLHNELLKNKMNEDSIDLNPSNSTWIPEKLNKNKP